MNPQFLNIIRTQVKQVLGITDKNVLSRYMTAEAARQGKKNMLHFVRDTLFVVTHSIKDTRGGMVKKRPLKE